MAERPFDLVVVGDVNPDIVVRGAEPRYRQHEQTVDAIEEAIGGSASIMAVGAARLGLRVALVGAVGDDRFGRTMLEALAERGVDVTWCRTLPGRPTGASVILTRGDDRAILTALGTIGDLTADDVPDELLASACHVHIGSYYLLDGLRSGAVELARRAHRVGSSVSVDPNWDPTERWDGGLLDLLREIDVFLPNDAEARALAGQDDARDAAVVLAGGPDGPLVVVKLGPDGALAVGPDGVVVSVPPYRVTPLDATGAGDGFDAAFLAAHLDGRSVEAAVRAAVVAGALTTLAAGGTAGQPTRAELEAALAAWP